MADGGCGGDSARETYVACPALRERVGGFGRTDRCSLGSKDYTMLGRLLFQHILLARMASESGSDWITIPIMHCRHDALNMSDKPWMWKFQLSGCGVLHPFDTHYISLQLFKHLGGLVRTSWMLQVCLSYQVLGRIWKICGDTTHLILSHALNSILQQ